MQDRGSALDQASVLLSGGEHGGVDRGYKAGAENLSLSGYPHTTCLRQRTEAHGAAYYRGRSAADCRETSDRNTGYLSANHADFRISRGV